MKITFTYNPEEKDWYYSGLFPNFFILQKSPGKTRKEDGWEVVLCHFKNDSADNPITLWRGKYLQDAKDFVREIVYVNKYMYEWSYQI